MIYSISRCGNFTPQSGTTLIELIVSIVVISVALTGLMMTISLSMRHSSDGFVQIRAAELAQAYMDMLVTMEYDAGCIVSEEESARNSFNSLNCFENYSPKVDGWIEDSPPWNVNATLGGDYSSYQVNFYVDNSTSAQLDGKQGKMIHVDVLMPSRVETIRFSTFRARF